MQITKAFLFVLLAFAVTATSQAKHLETIVLQLASSSANLNTSSEKTVASHSKVQAEDIKIPDVTTLPEGTVGQAVFVRKLLTISSPAIQVKKSDNLQAKKEFAQAISQYNKAIDETDSARKKLLLDDVVKRVFKAAKLSTTEQMTSGKQQQDFNKKLASLHSLMNALERISQEKHKDNLELKATLKHISDMEKEAIQAFEKHNELLAMKTLEPAYLLVKTSVQNLRQGDVLVRSLNFESKQEEYEYELDRNNTHYMLLKMLVEKKTSLSDYSKQKIMDYRLIAESLSAEAKAAAQKNDHEQAIKHLEKSTKNLIRAIRIGGVFIPG